MPGATALDRPGITQTFNVINLLAEDPVQSVRKAAQTVRAHMMLGV